MIVVYNHFESPLVQRVVEQEIPDPGGVLESGEQAPALVGDFIRAEPELILERLLPVYVETELPGAAGVRGVRAGRPDDGDAQRLEERGGADREPHPVNRARQAEITQEILEVVAGADAPSFLTPSRSERLIGQALRAFML